MSERLRSSFNGLVIGLAIIAAIAGSGALLVSTDSWARWFQHPARQPLPETTIQGAMLWRIMLGVSAASLVAAAFVLTRRSNQIIHLEGVRARSRKRLWGMIGLLLLAILVRATRITESLWYDEIAAWLTYGAGIDSPGPIIGNYFDPVNHVFHTLLSWISVRASESTVGPELAMRLPALLFSMLSVMAMVGLGRAAHRERVGWLAGFVAALAPVSVLEGVEARGYSMMIFFSAAATWLLIEARSRKRPWLWIAYAVACALGIWAHFVTAFVPIGHAAWLIGRAIRTRQWTFDEWRAFTALGLAAVLSITLYAAIIPDMLQTRSVFFSSRGNEPNILGPEGFHALLQLGGSWYWWAALPGLALLGGGVATLRRKRQWDVMALTMIGLPLMVMLVWISGSWMYARFTFFALPGTMLLMAVGLDVLWSRQRAMGLIAAIILGAAWMIDLGMRPPKQPLREAAEIVRAQAKPNDHVLVIGLAHEVMRVYLDEQPLTYSLRFGRDLEPRLDAIPPRYVIVEYPDHVSASTFELLQSHGFVQIARLDGWVDWGHGDVIVMERDQAQR